MESHHVAQRIPDKSSKQKECVDESSSITPHTKMDPKNIHPLGIQSPCQMMIGVYNHLLHTIMDQKTSIIQSFDVAKAQVDPFLPIPICSSRWEVLKDQLAKEGYIP